MPDRGWIIKAAIEVLSCAMLTVCLFLSGSESKLANRIRYIGPPDWWMLVNALLIALVAIFFEVLRD